MALDRPPPGGRIRGSASDPRTPSPGGLFRRVGGLSGPWAICSPVCSRRPMGHRRWSSTRIGLRCTDMDCPTAGTWFSTSCEPAHSRSRSRDGSWAGRRKRCGRDRSRSIGRARRASRGRRRARVRWRTRRFSVSRSGLALGDLSKGRRIPRRGDLGRPWEVETVNHHWRGRPGAGRCRIGDGSTLDEIRRRSDWVSALPHRRGRAGGASRAGTRPGPLSDRAGTEGRFDRRRTPFSGTGPFFTAGEN